MSAGFAGSAPSAFSQESLALAPAGASQSYGNTPQLPATDAASRPQLRKLAVPPQHAKSIATKLSLQFRETPMVQIAPDVKNKQLVVMAPEAMQQSIAREVQSLLASHMEESASPEGRSPIRVAFKQITWREFEDDLQGLSDTPIPVTTSQNGERAAFQLAAVPLGGATVEVDRRNNSVTVVAPTASIAGWEKMIETLDHSRRGGDQVTNVMRLKNAEPAPVQRAIRLLKELESHSAAAAPVAAGSPFRNAVFQQPAVGGQAGGAATADVSVEVVPEEGGAGVIGDTQIQFVPELGTIIIRGAKRDVQRVMDVIKQIEEQSEITKPEIEVAELQHADSNAVATLLQQLYTDVLSARQGEVSITSLDSPNALLLIGRAEAIKSLKDLIVKIDQPVSETSRLRIFRLQNASAVDAEQTIQSFFADRPGAGDDYRPGVGPRVRVLADYRTNSLIISAAPRDMEEVTRLINDLDVHQVASQNQIKIFTLSNAVAEDLAPVIQEAINGEGEGGSDNMTRPSATLSIVSIDSENSQLLDSGILAGAVITADTGANSIVVRAPAASMALIGELIRQLDRAPGVESLVKVFTIENGDALQLTAALQDLFGDEAATSGTSVGAGNLGGLPSSSAGGDNSLVPLRFSTDQRTNAIIASGSSSDLEVVESILLRLDSEGFAERITEVIWLRHQAASDVATALTSYVQQRTQTVNTIQQFQQGLGPYDLPDRDLIVVAEPVTNSILLSVSPRLYEDVRRLVDRLDRRPPMVLIKVLIAEVALDDAFEIGGEVGLQDSLVYDRGVAAGAFPGATPPSTPGYNFNNVGQPNLNSFGQGNVAGRGVSSFGVGTTNSALGYGGFVLSAASDSISLLLRTLQDANRLQILSRPQIMTVDNTEGFVQVGRQVARIRDVTQNVSGSLVSTEDIEVGLILRIRPRVGSDGLIVMDVDATRSARDSNNGTPIPAGDGSVVIIDDILRTTAQSVVAAYSGQTVVFGGLIQKERSNFSRRVPYLADIPILGYMFKYEQEVESRKELLVVLTPMLVTGEEDLEYVKQVESSRMSWCLADVVEAHGDVGLSGGYGLWGPTTGAVIYPDLQPTVDEVIIHDSYPAGSDPTIYDSSFGPINGGMPNSPSVMVPGDVGATGTPIYSQPYAQPGVYGAPAGSTPITPSPMVTPAPSIAPAGSGLSAPGAFVPAAPGVPGASAVPQALPGATSLPTPSASMGAAGTASQVNWVDQVQPEFRSGAANRPRPVRIGTASSGINGSR
ncbi:secretin N-terminal domain-containing protein [Rubripirellula lacrimiformis]|uniref:secretin N-terminal domain-containing protein n=1 Tax=Rubripirellula lacrimiformis TaxID=1930273 RepID=UPI001FE7BCFF|nr:secretin N-terminal domain-containing protein [Rubripirellula lacrimiformis]